MGAFDSLPGSTGPLTAFPANEKCKKSKCYFRTEAGDCVFETCLIEELPPTTMSRTFKCIICDQEDTIGVFEMDGPICKKCLIELKKCGNLVWTCGICGSSGGARAIPLTNICDKCIAKINNCTG